MFAFVRDHRLVRVALLLALCLLVPACKKSKMTKTNFDKITTGMTLLEVENILGKGSKDESGDGSNVAGQFGVDVQGVGGSTGSRNAETYVWSSMNKSIKVTFVGGK